ncbi:MAG: acyltransferase family protein, partial [Gammaproteobacteria bacterium]|nr:acyltransferase family protein [Gammaproteobacteria bacterium]
MNNTASSRPVDSDSDQASSKRFSDAWFERHIDKALRATPPQSTFTNVFYQIVKRTFRPELIDVENLPDRPCLFVGNHSLFALDGFIVSAMLYKEHGRWLRGLGDRFLWNDKTEDFMVENGGVCGDPRVCAALMEHGSDLMVFPGGAHEATKTEAQKYTLQWKQRYGFVRMAIAHGYPIMPMALVGPDEFYSHLLEGEDLPGSPLGQLLERFGLLDENTREDMLSPVPRGMLGTLLPRPQRCFIQFGTPVETSQYTGKEVTQRQLST